MPNYYTRYADPHVTFVMIEVRVVNEDGRPSEPFHVRITEEDFDNLQANSRRQYERGAWPMEPRGIIFRPPGGFHARSEPNWGGPRYTSPQEEYEAQRREYEKFKRAQQDARDAREKAEREKQEYFNNFGQAPNPNVTKTEKQLKERLAELAGTVWIDGVSLKTLHTKAQRRCHPDLETGSHELWLELEEIAHLLGIVLKKKPARNHL